MTADTTQLDVFGLVGIEYTDNGKSVRLEIVDTMPPYGTRSLTFRNAYVVRLCQDRDDGFPFVICEMNLCHVRHDEKKDILTRLQYPFFDEAGIPHLMDQTLLVAHLEGAMTGDILAESVDFSPEGEKGDRSILDVTPGAEKLRQERRTRQ
jgi:hypothetical protein